MGPTNYRTRLGTVVACSWSIMLVGVVAFFATDSTTDFFHWGPSNVRFGGFYMNTWPRWGLVMAYSVLSQVTYSTVSATLSPFISNVIRDHKTPREQKGWYLAAHGIVQVYTFYHWISSIFDVFLWITLQVQYIVPAIVTDLVITAYFTKGYLNVQSDILLDTCQ